MYGIMALRCSAQSNKHQADNAQTSASPFLRTNINIRYTIIFKENSIDVYSDTLGIIVQKIISVMLDSIIIYLREHVPL